MAFLDDFSANHLTDPGYYQQSVAFPPTRHEVVDGRCRLRDEFLIGPQLVLGGSQPNTNPTPLGSFEFHGVVSEDAYFIAAMFLQSQGVDAEVGPGDVSILGLLQSLPGFFGEPRTTVLVVTATIHGVAISGSKPLAPEIADYSGKVELEWDRNGLKATARLRSLAGVLLDEVSIDLDVTAADAVYPVLLFTESPTTSLAVDNFYSGGAVADVDEDDGFPPYGDPRVMPAVGGYRFLD